MTSVFVSHSSHDHELIQAHILPILEEKGLQPWFSKDSIQAADEWERKIKEALDASDWFLVVISRHSVDSPWVKAEVNWAFSHRKGRIVPVLVDDSDPTRLHLLLSQIQYVDFREQTAASQRALLTVWDSQNRQEVRHLGNDVQLTGERAFEPSSHYRRSNSLLALTASVLIVVAAMLSAVPWWPNNPGVGLQGSNGADLQKLSGKKRRSEETQNVLSLPTDSDQTSSSLAGSLLSIAVGLEPKSMSPPNGGQGLPIGQQVTYSGNREDDQLIVDYSLPYLERLEKGEVQGISSESPFAWEFPKLSVKVVNNSPEVVYLTEVKLDVTKSDRIEVPIPGISTGDYAKLIVWNEGWDELVDAVIRLSPAISPDSDFPSQFAFTSAAGTIRDRKVLPFGDLARYMPESFRSVDVAGEIEHGSAEHRQIVPFRTTMSLVPPMVASGAPLEPTYTYPTVLEAGKSDETRIIPISQVIKPGEADHFLIQLAANQSARFDLNVTVYDADRQIAAQQPVHLNLFVPRSEAHRIKENPNAE